ncbi:MAG: hypothetical protein V2I54_12480 [Bacteroidales bacterium]|jgi:phenylacetate-CoA ligase|nr:hypothetical protein [Bacteroidales bacterium]
MTNKILINILYRNKILKQLKEANRVQWFSYNEIMDYQEKKLNDLIQFISKNNDYYSSIGLSQVKNTEDLKKMPFLTKDIIRNEFDKLQTRNLNPNRFRKNSTSGSTGKATYYYSDMLKKQYSEACRLRGDSWTGWEPFEYKIVLWGAERDIKKNLKTKIRHSRFFFNTDLLSSFKMSNNDIISYIHYINKKKPVFIIGYPSALDVLAQFIINHNFIVYSPKGIITGGETLFETQRESIQKAFNCKVLNRYGGREVHHIANECEEQNGLHISSDHVILEVVDKEGNSCKPGELGEIVLTDLDNYVFPFIRYKIGDVGILEEKSKKCKCGRGLPLIRRVEGRTTDIVIGTNGNRISGIFFPLIRKKVKGVEEIQVVQEEYGKLEINVKRNSLYDNNKSSSEIINIIKNELGRDMIVNINYVSGINVTQTGKLQRVISKVSPYI